ncbi:MAG: YfiR family protein [Gammaproteobacteria bacterium]|nr:MAG: YfiR family protein [Gammaproteobacteria bacterium]
MQDSWCTQGHKRIPFGNSLRPFVMVILFVVASSSVQAAPPAPDDLVKIRLAMTIGQHYVRYAKSDPPPEPIKLCVVGPDRFSTFFRQKAIHSHASFRYFTRQIDEDMSDCHVVFLTLSNRHNIEQVLKALYGKPILTVSDHREFLQAGGMLAFSEEGGRVVFKLNPLVAQSCGLQFRAEVMRLAKQVIQIPPQQFFPEGAK